MVSAHCRETAKHQHCPGASSAQLRGCLRTGSVPCLSPRGSETTAPSKHPRGVPGPELSSARCCVLPSGTTRTCWVCVLRGHNCTTRAFPLCASTRKNPLRDRQLSARAQGACAALPRALWLRAHLAPRGRRRSHCWHPALRQPSSTARPARLSLCPGKLNVSRNCSAALLLAGITQPISRRSNSSLQPPQGSPTHKALLSTVPAQQNLPVPSQEQAGRARFGPNQTHLETLL